MSALTPKADIGTQSRNVRYVPIADMPLIDRLDVIQLPRLVEKSFSRAVEAKDWKPALACNGLDPVARRLRLVRCEVNVDGPVRIHFRIGVTADRRQRLTIRLRLS